MSKKEKKPTPVHLRKWIFFSNLPENWGLTQKEKSERWKSMSKDEKKSYDCLPSVADNLYDEYSASEWEQIRRIREEERKRHVNTES